MIIFVCRSRTLERLWGNEYAVKTVRKALIKLSSLGAISGSWVLAEAEIVQDKKATIFPSAIDKLRESGSIYVNQRVVKDENTITASGSEAVEKFGERIRESLSSKALSDVFLRPERPS